MIVGVPGSGIGGLYYILLGLGMPLCEVVQTVCGRSSWTRWRVVGTQAGYAVGILAALAGGGWLLQAALGWALTIMSSSPAVADARRHAIAYHLQAVGWSWMAWLSALTLLTVILLPTMLACVLSLCDRMAARKALRVDCAHSDDLKAPKDL